ncbi:MAG TPA: biopolymer transporter ExbD [Blastocatellia bacterium]|nr:biopolymer transporter ExbD [Blastocatellia bacterium]
MRNKPQPVINVTPLIDVLLVLLIIFMVISPTKPRRFAAQIPEKNSSEASPPMPSVVVNVAADGSLRLNDREMKSDELEAELTRLMNERPTEDRNVFISGAPSLSYQAVVRVIDLAKSAGAEREGLVLDQVN